MKDTKITYKGKEMNDIDDPRVTAKADMCDHYCVYGSKIGSITDAEYDTMLDEICSEYPLNVL